MSTEKSTLRPHKFNLSRHVSARAQVDSIDMTKLEDPNTGTKWRASKAKIWTEEEEKEEGEKGEEDARV